MSRQVETKGVGQLFGATVGTAFLVTQGVYNAAYAFERSTSILADKAEKLADESAIATKVAHMQNMHRLASEAEELGFAFDENGNLISK